MNVDVGPLKRGRKYDQVIEGARAMFMRDGYEGAGVDEIAAAAGVSKATLYSYFPDKGALFMEVARGECERQTHEAIADLDLDAPPREVLTRAGNHMLCFFLSDFGQQVFRMLVAESVRFPDLGRAFYEAVPQHVQDTMSGYFRAAIARGELKIDDLELAADQFHELCKAWLWPRMIFGVQRRFSKAETDRVIAGAVEMFMARYGT